MFAAGAIGVESGSGGVSPAGDAANDTDGCSAVAVGSTCNSKLRLSLSMDVFFHSIGAIFYSFKTDVKVFVMHGFFSAYFEGCPGAIGRMAWLEATAYLLLLYGRVGNLNNG